MAKMIGLYQFILVDDDEEHLLELAKKENVGSVREMLVLILTKHWQASRKSLNYPDSDCRTIEILLLEGSVFEITPEDHERIMRMTTHGEKDPAEWIDRLLNAYYVLMALGGDQVKSVFEGVEGW